MDPFIAALPKAPKHDDEIILRGKIKDCACSFTIDLSLDENLENVAYRLEVNFKQSTVYHQWKDGNRPFETISVDENTSIRTGENFDLKFSLKEDRILVYVDNNYQYSFDNKLEIKDIYFVQVTGDFDYISEITFRYANK